MANQLFTMLAKLNLLQGNIDNYNVYIYIYDFIHFTFSFIHWLDGKILKSALYCHKWSKTLEMPQICVGSILCWYNISSGKAETLVSIKYPILHACTILYNNCEMWQSRHVINLMLWHYLASRVLLILFIESCQV